MNKLTLGIAAIGAMALIGSAGAVSAHALSDPGKPTSKEQCKKGGWQKYGFKNQGQCVSWVAKNQNGGGNGYGGNGNGNHVNNNVNVSVNGNNNVVSVVINYLFGH